MALEQKFLSSRIASGKLSTLSDTSALNPSPSATYKNLGKQTSRQTHFDEHPVTINKDEIKLKKRSGNEQVSSVVLDFDVPPVGEIDGMD